MTWRLFVSRPAAVNPIHQPITSHQNIMSQTLTLDQVRIQPRAKLSVRVNESNDNHHLWNNRGTWWCHFTLHKPDYTTERIRLSLKTRDLEEARRKRDRLLAACGG